MKNGLCSGKLKKWKDDRGFGFIQPIDGGPEIYLHISGLKDPTRRPQENDTIYYQTTVNSDGKTRACNAFILDAGVESISFLSAIATVPIAQILRLTLIPGLGTIHFTWVTKNPTPLILYPVASVLTYYLYADDKNRAEQNMWRTSERELHLFELAGGWIGGFLAQRALHHKNRKPNYQFVFWSIVAIHHMAWIWWFLFGRLLFK